MAKDSVPSKSILLIIGGGIAAYKSLELIRALAKEGVTSRCILTKGGAEFVTPLSVSALSGEKVYQDLFDLTDEAEMGHIELSRSADLVVVAPATADLIAKAANGLANDLASTALLATDKPVLYAPAMNVRMWLHGATQRNVATLRTDGATVIDPDEGAMACGEYGPGRLPEVGRLKQAILTALNPGQRPLSGRRAIVTAGPTLEPIDPVRFLSNRSSGKQGYAIAGALAELGAQVTLISGPTALPAPTGVARIDVETAREMLTGVETALPADVFVSVAAVADWRPSETAELKIKKKGDAVEPLSLEENPDILRTISQDGARRPRLVIGFAAETNDVVQHAKAKLAKKGCDWIVANDVSGDVMGGDENTFIILTADSAEHLPKASKADAAARLAQRIADALTDEGAANAAE